MSWNYRVVKLEEDGEVSFGIHEVYYTDGEGGRVLSARTERAVPVYETSLESLRLILTGMLAATYESVLVDDDFVSDE